MRGFTCSVVVLGLVLSLAARADAHAILVESVPASGAAVDGPVVAVRLVFNSRIDVARSTLRLTGEVGGLPRALELIPDGEQEHDAAHRERLRRKGEPAQQHGEIAEDVDEQGQRRFRALAR